MPYLHRVAIGATIVVVLALAVDTVVLVATGERTFVTDDAKLSTTGDAVLGLVMGGLFASLAWVVATARPGFEAAPRLARWSRWPLLVGLAALALGIGLLSSALRLAGIDGGPVYDVSGLLALLALAATFLGALGTGLATVRRNPLGVGGRLLSLILPVLAGTAVLALVAPDLASPVFTTAVVLLGVSLLGVGAGTTPAGAVGRPRAGSASR